jgi:hypothetical protein
MRILFAIAVVCALLSLPASLRAQQVQVYPIASNFSGKGMVVELDFPEKDAGRYFYAVYLVADGQGNVPMQARAGRHCYEMRNLNRWEGPVRLVGITVPNIAGRLKKPTFSDEIDMYLQPPVLTPSIVNVIDDHGLFAWPENILLAVVALISALTFLLLKKTPATQSAVLGFLIAWGVMSLHRVYDHIAIVSTTETHKPGLFGVADLKEFIDRASGLIGKETWEDDLDGFYRSYLHYRLAQNQYVPKNSGAAAFRITRNPGGGKVLLQNAEYYLVKNTQH